MKSATALLLLGLVALAAAEPGKGHVWTNLGDLLDSKNNTQGIAHLVDNLIGWNIYEGSAQLAALLNATDSPATIFLPRDENITEADLAKLDDLLNTDAPKVLDIVKYHIVPGKAITLDQFKDGEVLQTLLEGPEGQLTVSISNSTKTGKPTLHTSSGQKVQVYQYDLQAGAAQVYTIKGILMPGTGAAPAPATTA